jgi:RHS repeat-associated protein
VWRWDQQEPFGDNAPDEDPSSLGAFDLPLRLPGQRYDKETNLHYNNFRDFDPSIGRYAESDPVGLDAGINTYAYVLSDPVRYADPSGRYIPGAHNSLSYTQAMGTCVQSQAALLGQKTGDVDDPNINPDSQTRGNAYKHNMCPPNMPAGVCKVKIANYIQGQLSLCTLDGLANALHDIQDGFALGHSGGKVWYGLPGTPGGASWWAMSWHVLIELVPGTGAAAGATKAAIKGWCNRCRRCPAS